MQINKPLQKFFSLKKINTTGIFAAFLMSVKPMHNVSYEPRKRLNYKKKNNELIYEHDTNIVNNT